MSEDLPPQKSESVKTTLFTPSLYGGRFTRMQFWCYSLLGGFFSGAVDFLLGDGPFVKAILLLYAILYALPIAVKRCHDIGASIYMLLGISVLPTVAIIVCGLIVIAARIDGQNTYLETLLSLPYMLMGIKIVSAFCGLIATIVLGFVDSEKGTNKYGPSIKYPDTAA